MCVCTGACLCVVCMCVYIMCAYLSCPTAFVAAVVVVMSRHIQTHTLTTYGVNKLQAIAQGLNWSQDKERKEGGSKRESDREVAGHGARQLASVELSIALWLGILWPQVNSLTNAEHIYLFTSAADAVAISISICNSSSPTPAPSSLVCRTCRVFVQLANSKQIKNKQQPETRIKTTTTMAATTTITSRTNSYVTEQNVVQSTANNAVEKHQLEKLITSKGDDDDEEEGGEGKERRGCL